MSLKFLLVMFVMVNGFAVPRGDDRTQTARTKRAAS